MPLPELETLLAYKNDAVLERYNVDFPNNELSAEAALQEVMKFLWAAQKLQQDRKENPGDESLDFRFMLHAEMTEIDDMWHTFILFTKDYMDFCNHYFGHYVHHAPTTQAEKERMQARSEEYLNIELPRQLSYVYDTLGEETLMVWFAEHFSEEDECVDA